jgi:hypothetical protein
MTNSNEKVTEKTINISSVIDFAKLGIISEATQTTVERSESNGLKSCDKLIIIYTRASSKKIYGFKKDKIEKDKEQIAKVDDYLKAIYDSSDASGDEEKDPDMCYDDWKNKLAFQRSQAILMQRARSQAIKIENTNADNLLASLDSMSQSGKLDMDAIMKMQAMIDAAKKMMEAAKIA